MPFVTPHSSRWKDNTSGQNRVRYRRGHGVSFMFETDFRSEFIDQMFEWKLLMRMRVHKSAWGLQPLCIFVLFVVLEVNQNHIRYVSVLGPATHSLVSTSCST